MNDVECKEEFIENGGGTATMQIAAKRHGTRVDPNACDVCEGEVELANEHDKVNQARLVKIRAASKRCSYLCVVSGRDGGLS